MKICVLPGDGIGGEVIPAAVKVLKTVVPDAEFVDAVCGYEHYQKTGNALPDETVETIRSCDATLFGAVTTPPNIPDYFSVIIRLRKTFNLYANLRPVRPYGLSDDRDVNLVVVRENTEGLYAGYEDGDDDIRIVSHRVITRKASERIVRFAYEYAKKHGRKSVTLVHKANVIRRGDGLFRKTGLLISEDYQDIPSKEMLVDAMAMRLIKDPESFDVIVTTNLFGDILSDEASMLAGGLGLAASGNIGEDNAIFEPVHGSAPDIVGKGIANPFAAVLTGAMLLRHLGEGNGADRIEKAVRKTISDGITTVDLGGTANTKEVTDTIIRNLQ